MKANAWRRGLVVVLCIAASYDLLLRATEVWGTRSARELVTIRAATEDDEKVSICDPRLGTEIEEISEPHFLDQYCRATALAPFIVGLDFGYHCGVLCGEGHYVWVFWIPGYPIPFRAETTWLS